MFFLLFSYGSWAILILRLALGLILVAHGWPKIKDLKQNGANFNGMGFKPGMFWGTVAAVLEFFGGIAIIIGLYTIPFAFLLAGQFVVIIIWKWAKGMPLTGANGWELDLIILAALVVLIALGAGPYAFDRIFLGAF